MKLKLKPYIPPNPKKPNPCARTPAPPDPYKSPVRWWRVTTEGDCEGRGPETNLGEHYGHVAEIALSLPQSAMYSYRFTPVDKSEPGERPTRQSIRETAWVSLGDVGLWHRPDSWWKFWLDCDEIEVSDRAPNCQYYASKYIKLRK